MQWGDELRELCGGTPDTTNNRMEMMAVIQGLESLKYGCEVTVTTDSKYVIRGMTEWMEGWVRRGWHNSEGKPTPNKDLWLLLVDAAERHTIEWVWVKGHRGHPENERADRLADQGRLQSIAEEAHA